MNILPKSISAIVLLIMSVFVYDRYINWRRLKETKSYLIKSIIAVVLAVLLNMLVAFLYSTNTPRDFIEIPDFIIAIVIGVIWYKEYKKIQKQLKEK